MNFDENTMEIIGYASAAVVAVTGGAWFAIKKSKLRKNNARQSSITQTGDGNKVTGGDDNSNTTITK